MGDQLKEKVVHPFIDFQPDDCWQVKDDESNISHENTIDLGNSKNSNISFTKQNTTDNLPCSSIINGVLLDESDSSSSKLNKSNYLPGVGELKQNNEDNLECRETGQSNNCSTSQNTMEDLRVESEQFLQKLSVVADELKESSSNYDVKNLAPNKQLHDEGKSICVVSGSVKNDFDNKTENGKCCKTTESTSKSINSQKLGHSQVTEGTYCSSNNLKNSNLSESEPLLKAKNDECLTKNYKNESQQSQNENNIEKEQSFAHEITGCDANIKVASLQEDNLNNKETGKVEKSIDDSSDLLTKENNSVKQKVMVTECEEIKGNEEEKRDDHKDDNRKNLASKDNESLNKDSSIIEEDKLKTNVSTCTNLQNHSDQNGTTVEKDLDKQSVEKHFINENKEGKIEKLIKPPKGLVVKPVEVKDKISQKSSHQHKTQLPQYTNAKAAGKVQDRPSDKLEVSNRLSTKGRVNKKTFDGTSARDKQTKKTGKCNDSLTNIPDILKSGLLKHLTISVIPSSKNEESQKSLMQKSIPEKPRDKPREKPKEKPPELHQEKYKEQPLPPLLESICGSVVTDEMVEKILKEAEFPEIFKDKVNIGKFIPVKLPDSYNFRLCEDEALLECPSMVTPLLLKKKDKFPTKVTLHSESNFSEVGKNRDGLSESIDNSTSKVKSEKNVNGLEKESAENNDKLENMEKIKENTKDTQQESIKTVVSGEKSELKPKELEEASKGKEPEQSTDNNDTSKIKNVGEETEDISTISKEKTEGHTEKLKHANDTSETSSKEEVHYKTNTSSFDKENTVGKTEKLLEDTKGTQKSFKLSSDEEKGSDKTEKSKKDTNETRESSSENNKKVQEESKELFTSSAVGFLTAIGLSRVQEWHKKDLLRSKERQIRREGKTKQLENESLIMKMAYLQAKKANEPFVFGNHKCDKCEFKSESSIVMDGHSAVPFVTPRREFGCHLCDFCTRDPKAILFHMEAEHKKLGQLPAPSHFHECPFCPFDTNQKQKLNSHMNRCQKFFVLGRNQATELEISAQTAKPITLMDIKTYLYERQLVEMASATMRRPGCPSGSRGGHRKQSPRQQGNVPRSLAPVGVLPYNRPMYQHLADNAVLQSKSQIRAFNRTSAGSSNNKTTNTRVTSSSRQVPLTVPTSQIYKVVEGGKVLPMITTTNSAISCKPVTQVSNAHDSGPQPVALFTNVAAGGTHMPTNNTKSLLKAGMPPPPRLQGPFLPSTGNSAPGETILPSNSFVICEICDGYIKDQEQLRNHMQLIHKVKIHPKMLQNRPPLNCQKCQWRFFTDQGLERHLLGSHGLVTSNMQELAQKNQDAGRCTICGLVYACKLVAHMNQVHKITLKPAHLSYKCTVCTATFNLYKLFENHVYVVHSGSVKRHADDISSNQPTKKHAGDKNTKMGTPKITPRSRSRKPAMPVKMGAECGKTRDDTSVSTQGNTPKEDGHAKQKCGIETLGCRRSPRRRNIPVE
ncbi:uncharacterized protein LOC106471718 [Limulus polyphemus]|uniref:Uncharacterized protein LOC106471718 n=1 Tax=Limulus polyphemus TaxID=6850 RepID=A0ABM1BSG9_LIMPO|nr:uncharacterized protein LOC106471718 [Limulus polyphemus]